MECGVGVESGLGGGGWGGGMEVPLTITMKIPVINYRVLTIHTQVQTRHSWCLNPNIVNQT